MGNYLIGGIGPGEAFLSAFFADKVCLLPNYLGDLMKTQTGISR